MYKRQPAAEAIVPPAVQKIKRHLAENGPDSVLYTMDTHAEDYLSTKEGRNLPVKHCIKMCIRDRISIDGDIVA